MDNSGDDKKEMSVERDSSTDTAPDKQSTSTKSMWNRNRFCIEFHFMLFSCFYLRSWHTSECNWKCSDNEEA